MGNEARCGRVTDHDEPSPIQTDIVPTVVQVPSLRVKISHRSSNATSYRAEKSVYASAYHRWQ
jgi:hypothetical protein